MIEPQTSRALVGTVRLTWRAFGSGLLYVAATVYAVSFVPVVALGAVDATLKTSPAALVFAGFSVLALLPFAGPGLAALWFTPSSAVRAPENALRSGLSWLGKAAWAGTIFVFAVVFGAVVGVTATGISDLGHRYESCVADSAASTDCQRAIAVVQSAGGIDNLYVNELERGTFFPIVAAAVSIAVLLLGIRYMLGLKRLIRNDALGAAILAAFDHGRAVRPMAYTPSRAVVAIRFARRWSPVSVFLLGIACAFFVDFYVRWLVIR